MDFFSKQQGTVIKIISLAIGLTVGLVLIAKVQLERNYDRCIADKEHVFEVAEVFQRQGKDAEVYGATSGGVIPLLCQYIPEIVVGTRYTGHFSDSKLQLEDGQRYEFRHTAFADSSFFDIFETPILQGRAKEILSTAGQCLISKRLYDKLGDDVLGKTFCFREAPGKPITVKGVFDNYDENSTFSQFDILMSMPSIGTYTWDGTSNLIGNDRYHSFVRLHADADMEKVKTEIDAMLKEAMPWDQLKANGFEDVGYKLNSVKGKRMNNTTVRTTSTILLIVALVMLFTAVMNYILVVVSSLVGRAKQMAVRKCMGAPRREFFLTTLKEASLHLLLALLLMAFLLFVGQDLIRDLVGVSVRTLISSQTLAVLLLVCLLVLLSCGLLPGYIYSRIPLVYAYRQYSESKRVWKLSLLAFQFVLSTMLLCVLSTIYRQYDYLLNKDMGYAYDDVAYIEIAHPSDSTYTLAREIEKLPCVECTTAAYSLFIQNQSGNNVLLPNDSRELFNYASLYWAEASIVKTMKLTLLQGKGFTPVTHPGWEPEVLVDERFAEQLKANTGWDDVLGKNILSTEIGEKYPLTIVGVVKNFTIGSLICPDTRPAMMFNGNVFANYILVKFHQLTADHLEAVQQLCHQLQPDAELNVKPYAFEILDSYQDTQRTRNLISIGCFASLLITLIGLIGYIRDEIQRRTRELAIRKVLGADIVELQGLFFRSIVVIALPSILVGVGLGYYLSELLMQQFPDKLSLSWPIFLLDALLVLLIISLVIYLQTHRIAQKNPSESIRTE
ncbi:MAG: ABC transporter permease [Bacteroidaceae bacterium]|nr:ABC transporter permease [Bacteroidaceae bacterium]